MRTPPLPVPSLRSPWTSEVLARSTTTVVLAARHHDGRISHVHIHRCAEGRLRSTYPVGRHDIGVDITDADGSTAPLYPDLLAFVTAAVEIADPRCRRIVVSLPVTAADDIAVAERSGLRAVVEIDLPGAELLLMVAEPTWIRDIDGTAGQVPGT